MKTYVLTADDKILECSRIIAPTDTCSSYILTIKDTHEIYQTDHNWGLTGTPQRGAQLWFFPLSDERIKKAYAAYENL